MNAKGALRTLDQTKSPCIINKAELYASTNGASFDKRPGKTDQMGPNQTSLAPAYIQPERAPQLSRQHFRSINVVEPYGRGGGMLPAFSQFPDSLKKPLCGNTLTDRPALKCLSLI